MMGTNHNGGFFYPPRTQSLKESGQILLLAAFALAGLCFLLLAFVRMSVHNQDKLHIEQVAYYAADAAAIIAVRDLNYKAITNRAILANEVVVGQLLGMGSLLKMTDIISRNAALITVWFPPVGGPLRAVERIAYTVQRSSEKAIQSFILIQTALKEALSKSQQIFHLSGYATTLKVMEDVIKANDQGYELVLLNHATLPKLHQLWTVKQSRATGKKEQDQYVNWVSQSRDPFTEKRSYNWVRLYLANIDKYGGTEIGHDRGVVHWQSVDTVSLSIFDLLSVSETPIGWGGFFNNKNPRSSPLFWLFERERFGGATTRSRRAYRMALREQVRQDNRYQVPSMYRLTESVSELDVTVMIKKAGNEETRALPLWGVGRSIIYYSRPDMHWQRGDGHQESANLLNALWQRKKGSIGILEREAFQKQWQMSL